MKAQELNPGVYPPDSILYGKAYGEWSEEWWKWILSIPESSNPPLDETGEFCAEGQSGDIWFLASSWVGVTKLEYEVPAGKAIFIPIINTGAQK